MYIDVRLLRALYLTLLTASLAGCEIPSLSNVPKASTGELDDSVQSNSTVATSKSIPAIQMSGGDSGIGDGMSGSISVSLGGNPGKPVIVTVSSDDISRVTVSPSTLTFNASNFGTAQDVTLMEL